ncbi:hypothetical protein Patl1_35233 [Pistacia atlantica]|uniref:Uncharacterized protein n=1 Tax=Pistacia atlantica TaxID=434234 RepID=A0ACC0ZRV7_9ROSI|nr:hypothetical protein Patl1_35233 [Pistacia atlantica]
MATESPMRMVESSGARNWPSSKDSAMCGSQLKNMAAKKLGLLLKGHRFHGDQTDMILNQSGSAQPSLESLSDDLGHFESEEQLRSDFAYYCSNFNLNPRLPPPLISRENCSLSTHKEEPEDDRSPRQASDDWAENSPAFMSGHKAALEDFPFTLDVSTINLSEVPGSSGSADVCVHTSVLDSHDVALISKNDSVATSLSRSTGPDGAGSSQNSQIDDTNTKTADWRMMCQLLLPLIQRELGRNEKSSSIMGELCCNSNRLYSKAPISGSGSNGITRNESYQKWHGKTLPCGNLYAIKLSILPKFSAIWCVCSALQCGWICSEFCISPTFVTGYPPHGLVAMPFNATSGPSFSIQTTGISATESIPHMCDLQHQKFYGHHVDSSIQEEPPSAAYLGDQKLLSPPNGSLGIPNPRKLEISIGGYYEGLQAWMSWLNFQYRLFLVQCCHHYQLVEQVIQRGVNIFDDPKRHSFLKELKSSNAQKFELSDIAGRIVEFRQSWSTAVLKTRCLLSKILYVSNSMTDVFGNYVFEKFFDHGSPSQRKELADKLVGQMLLFKFADVRLRCDTEAFKCERCVLFMIFS